MPAASYREGPDGHSSRKQNSKRRRAKCSPSFVSGRVVGHGDISPRCIPECSAKALHRAVPAARPSRASTLSFVLLAGAFSKSCLRRRFFCGEGGSYLVRGESRRSSMARSSRMRSRATGSGNIPPRCVPGRQSVASFALHASRKWSRTGKSPVRGKIRAPCIRNELALARCARHVSEKPRKPPLEDTPREYLAKKGPFCCTGPSNHA